MIRTTDQDVRTALMKKVISEHVANPDTLVIEELGLDRGACRVDVAVINGHLHGYEIKSESDTLDRLPSQQALYSKVLDRASLVVSDRHISKAIELIPKWWGVRAVSIGARGAINVKLIRTSSLNPCICAKSLASLLWRDEIVALLLDAGVEKKALRANRAELCRIAAEKVQLRDLRSHVRACLKNRTTWRRREQP